jgi:hypothetical protein
MTTEYTPPKAPARHAAPIVPGLLLILLGLWLLGRQLNLPIFIGDVLWPWLIVAGSVLVWVHYIFFPPRSSEEVFWGTAGILTGLFLLGWRNGYLLPEVDGLARLWPVAPLIIGLASLVQWVFDIRRVGTLVWGVFALAVGVVGYSYFTIQTMDFVTAMSYARYWPLLLILAGLGVLITALLGRRSNRW